MDILIGQTLINNRYNHRGRIVDTNQVDSFTVLVFKENGRENSLKFDGGEVARLKNGGSVFGWRLEGACKRQV